MTYLSMHRGDDRTMSVTATEELTGSELVFTARHRKYSTDVVIEKSTGAGITIGTPATTAEIVVDRADTEDLDPDVLYWDLEVTDATDKRRTVATGRLAIREEVTRPAAP